MVMEMGVAATTTCTASTASYKDGSDGSFYCINGGTVGGTTGACTCSTCNAGYEGTSCQTAVLDTAALKAAVGTCTGDGTCTGGCLGETADGSCPNFAESINADTGKPYGVIGDWDVSAVTSMLQSKCTLSLPLCGHAFHCCVF